jgi:hypothetical protein
MEAFRILVDGLRAIGRRDLAREREPPGDPITARRIATPLDIERHPDDPR